jgi:hypothetical protein
VGVGFTCDADGGGGGSVTCEWLGGAVPRGT